MILSGVRRLILGDLRLTLWLSVNLDTGLTFFFFFFKHQIYILKGTKKIRSCLVSAFRLGFNLSLETLTDLRFSHQAKTRFCVGGLSCFSRVWLCATLLTVVFQVLCQFDSPGRSTGVGSQALLQGIFHLGIEPASHTSPA